MASKEDMLAKERAQKNEAMAELALLKAQVGVRGCRETSRLSGA